MCTMNNVSFKLLIILLIKFVESDYYNDKIVFPGDIHNVNETDTSFKRSASVSSSFSEKNHTNNSQVDASIRFDEYLLTTATTPTILRDETTLTTTSDGGTDQETKSTTTTLPVTTTTIDPCAGGK